VAPQKDDDLVTIFVPGAHLTPRYVIMPPMGETNGGPKARWIELRQCKAVDEFGGGVSITAKSKIFTSRGIKIADYETDFCAWAQEQARLLRAGEFSRLDIENVAEELESMGRRDKREIESQLEVLLLHLLKWQYQATLKSPSWSGTIREQRRRIEKLLRESPSLRPMLDELITEAYVEAREKAAEETGLPEETFPVECRFTFEQVLARDFLPED